jgi:hypothetical protein
LSEPIDVESCTRQVITIGGENYYIVVGQTFVMAVCPRENSPAMTQTRAIVNDICGAVTAIMEERAEKDLLLAEERNRTAKG